MEPNRNLVLVHTPQMHAISDWATIAEKVMARTPDIEARVVNNNIASPVTRRWQVSRPSYVFSTVRLRAFAPRGGTICAGASIDEMEQMRRLREAGLPAPRTIELLPGMALKPEIWGEYVVAKPLHAPGLRRTGSDLRIVRTAEVASRFAQLTNTGSSPRILVKQYIEHADERGHDTSYRVMTMFGHVLYAARIRVTEKRGSLAEEAAKITAIRSTDTRVAPRQRFLAYDEDVLDLARAAANVFPEVACHGIDILRETGTGRLFVIETNPGGNVWMFSSDLSAHYEPKFRKSLYTQFNALDIAADLLIQKTRAEAS